MSCPSKKCSYDGRKEAREAARKNLRHGKMRAYKCDQCTYWHLTTSSAVKTAHFKDLKAREVASTKNKRPRNPYGHATDRVLTRRSSIQYLSGKPEIYNVFGFWVNMVSK